LLFCAYYQMWRAFLTAMAEEKRPVIIEFMTDPDLLVLPMVQGGKALDDMILQG
ncbi:MAG: hypothetical protein Q4E73_03940, partial [Lachnospiraceae bacterium]|nr:hypothetical protein [Lachnospiraceae bacterium]